MTHDELRQRLAALAAGQTPADEQLRALARALTGQPDPGLDCEACRELLPEYVHAEASGLGTAARYPAVRAHLLLCADCEQEYIRQLDLAWRLARDELPRPASRPVPDLAFLRRPRPARPPERLPANPAAWWTDLRAVVGGIRAVLISFVAQGTFQPVAALEDQGFQKDEEGGLEHRRLIETVLPHVPEGVLSVTASRQEGADACELMVWLDSPQWEPGERLVRLLYGGGVREMRTDSVGRALFPDVPVAALPDLQVEIPVTDD